MKRAGDHLTTPPNQGKHPLGETKLDTDEILPQIHKCNCRWINCARGREGLATCIKEGIVFEQIGAAGAILAIEIKITGTSLVGVYAQPDHKLTVGEIETLMNDEDIVIMIGDLNSRNLEWVTRRPTETVMCSPEW